MKYRYPRGLIVTSIKRSQVKKEIIIEKKTPLRDMLIHFLTDLHSSQLKGKDLKNKRHQKPLSCLRIFCLWYRNRITHAAYTFLCPETLNVYKRKENHMTLVVNSTESLTCRVGKYQKIKLAPSVVIVSPRSNSQIIRSQIF